MSDKKRQNRDCEKYTKKNQYILLRLTLIKYTSYFNICHFHFFFASNVILSTFDFFALIERGLSTFFENVDFPFSVVNTSKI